MQSVSCNVVTPIPCRYAGGIAGACGGAALGSAAVSLADQLGETIVEDACAGHSMCATALFGGMGGSIGGALSMQRGLKQNEQR